MKQHSFAATRRQSVNDTDFRENPGTRFTGQVTPASVSCRPATISGRHVQVSSDFLVPRMSPLQKNEVLQGRALFSIRRAAAIPAVLAAAVKNVPHAMSIMASRGVHARSVARLVRSYAP